MHPNLIKAIHNHYRHIKNTKAKQGIPSSSTNQSLEFPNKPTSHQLSNPKISHLHYITYEGDSHTCIPQATIPNMEKLVDTTNVIELSLGMETYQVIAFKSKGRRDI